MKKLLLALILCLCGSVSQAQMSYESQIQNLQNLQNQIDQQTAAEVMARSEQAAIVGSIRMVCTNLQVHACDMRLEAEWLQNEGVDPQFQSQYDTELNSALSYLDSVDSLLVTASSYLDQAESNYTAGMVHFSDPVSVNSALAIAHFDLSIANSKLALIALSGALFGCEGANNHIQNALVILQASYWLY